MKEFRVAIVIQELDYARMDGTEVWVNRATSRRSKDVPEGDLSVPSVSSSNTFLGFYIVGIKQESVFIEFH